MHIHNVKCGKQIPGSYYEYQFGRTYSQNVIESPDKRKSFYEDVVQIGTKDDTGVGCPDSEAARECLTEYMNGFEQRNPNFRVFNAVLHMDEATPHLHIDYIPVGHYKRGIPVQNGISQALKEMGYGGGRDAIARWRKAEYDTLRKICEDHNIEIAEPQQSTSVQYRRSSRNTAVLSMTCPNFSRKRSSVRQLLRSLSLSENLIISQYGG